MKKGELTTKAEPRRCAWCTQDPIYQIYHDQEWGRPHHEDRHLFEMLNLEGAQAGLSWLTILKKRENFRTAFDHFDPEKMAGYDEKKIQNLLKNQGIIRNRLKIGAFISNAQTYLKVLEHHRSFDEYIWRFVEGEVKINFPKTIQAVPSTSHVSNRMSKALKADGFRFVGSTICYAYMQAVGMVDDHTLDCWIGMEKIQQT